MGHLELFVAAPELSETDLALLARQIAMDLVPRAEICGFLSINETELARVEADPSFADRVRTERRRLLSLDGQRDMAEWKQALVEHQFWDRLATIALNETTSSTVVVDAMKVVKRPVAKDVGPGGAGGPQFVINIALPGAEPLRVSAAPVLEVEAAE